MKIGKTLHPTPHTPHPTPTEKLFQQTLVIDFLLITFDGEKLVHDY
jgi:dihydrofolate synthase/folylpolyglutamate synthase